MREIKFRGKDIITGEWRYGEFTPEKMWPTKLVDCVGEYHSEPAQNVRPETVGQYTGLKDKNGREIYEGDILHDSYTDNTFEVYFDGGSFDVKGILEKDACYLNDISSDSEVIGNIHDNPELLKT